MRVFLLFLLATVFSYSQEHKIMNNTDLVMDHSKVLNSLDSLKGLSYQVYRDSTIIYRDYDSHQPTSFGDTFVFLRKDKSEDRIIHVGFWFTKYDVNVELIEITKGAN